MLSYSGIDTSNVTYTGLEDNLMIYINFYIILLCDLLCDLKKYLVHVRK